MRRSRLSRIVAVVAVAGAGASAALAPVAQAKPPPVFINGDSISNYTFAPRSLEVRRGATVHWTWDSNAPHNVTFRKLSTHSVTGASETFKHRFKRRGTFRYLCTVHGFRGKIIVK